MPALQKLLLSKLNIHQKYSNLAQCVMVNFNQIKIYTCILTFFIVFVSDNTSNQFYNYKLNDILFGRKRGLHNLRKNGNQIFMSIF